MLFFIKHIIPLVLLIVVYLPVLGQAGDLPSVSEEGIQFYLDDASFHNDGMVYQEFYLMIYADQISFNEKNGRKFAEVSIETVLRNKEKKILDTRNWETEAVLLDTAELANMVVYDQWAENLEPGNYFIDVTVTDLNSESKGSLSREFSAELNSTEEFFGSEIEFVSQVKENAGENDHFRKGNLSIMPNPSRRYGVLNPVLYFYYEIYNLQENNSENEVSIKYEISSSDGTSLRSLKQETKQLSGVTSGIINGINVSSVASGIYFLNIEITNKASGERLELSRRFEVIQLDYLSAEPLMTVEEAEKYGGLLEIISTKNVYDRYKSLSLSGKAKFLINFWKQNDPTPSTPENEYLQRIMERFNFANEKFSWGNIEGWKTDRGIILIKNGMPDNIQSFPSDPSKVPYEIWEYRENRNYIYVFGDLRADGRYTLIHSNKEGEIYNPYWKDELERI